MYLTDKQVQQLIKKISKQTAQKQKKIKITQEEKDQEIRSANADQIFREMKKLPFSD
jgi:esterase/lipase